MAIVFTSRAFWESWGPHIENHCFNHLLGRYWADLALYLATCDLEPVISRRGSFLICTIHNTCTSELGSQEKDCCDSKLCNIIWFHYEILIHGLVTSASVVPRGHGTCPTFWVSGFLGHKMAVSFGFYHPRKSPFLWALGIWIWGAFPILTRDLVQAGWPFGNTWV